MRILIVDDHTVMRQGIRRLLGTLPKVEFAEAGSAREAVLAARRARPDIVVLDINLRDSSGLELLRRMRHEWPGLRVVVFSMYAEVVYAVTARRLGALGFVSKSAEAEELLEAVRRAARGEDYIDHETARAIALAPGLPEGPSSLSGREVEILRLLAEGRSLAGISETLGIAYKTVANQCTRMKEKLGLDRTADLVRFALENRGENRGTGAAEGPEP
ncbi:response regulator transcription factor [Methylobacterium sp. A54F]